MPNTTKRPTDSFPIGFHAGNIVFHLASLYGSLKLVVREIVQNFLDAGAAKAYISLDLRRRRLCSYDNGCGASKEEIRARISRIGARTKDKSKIGQFGIGNLAAIAIIERPNEEKRGGREEKEGKYRLVTRPRNMPGESRFEVVFDPSMFHGREEASLQVNDLEPFKQSKKAGNPYIPSDYTTMVDVQRIQKSALREMKNPKEAVKSLQDIIVDSFSPHIKKTGIKIVVEVFDGSANYPVIVEPIEFKGTRHEIELETKFGPVKFDMYLTYEKLKDYQVLVDHQGKQSFHLRNLEEIWDDISPFFGCGHIQGYVRLGFCSLTGDRSRFEWDDELDAFHSALVEYFSDYGMPWLELARERRKLQRYYAILDRIERRLSRMGVLPDFLKRKVMVEDPKGDKEVKKPPRKKRNPPPPDPPEPKEEEETTPKEEKGKKKRKKKAKKRGKVSKGRDTRGSEVDKRGLPFEFKEGDPEHGYAWHARLGTRSDERGKIIINISHSDFRQAEDKGSMSVHWYLNFHGALRWVIRHSISEDTKRNAWDELCEKEIPTFSELFLIHPRL